jgi:hypothetical protein
LAARAAKWAQFTPKTPVPVETKKTTTLNNFFGSKPNAATLELEETTPLVPARENREPANEEKVQYVAPLEAAAAAEPARVTTTSTAAAHATTTTSQAQLTTNSTAAATTNTISADVEPTRASTRSNRGINMQAILKTLYRRPSRSDSLQEHDDDEDYEEGE